ncbi:MAG: cobalt-precorrin-6A reductase [Acidimicrobiia bacterium]
MARVLLLAGTAEATALAERLHAAAFDVVSSLAGVTRQPRPRPGRVRVGGFGGVPGLVRYLRDEAIEFLIDATHPFAAQMPFNAARAAEAVGIGRCRVVRPPWVESAGDRWTTVRTVEDAPAAVRRLGAQRVLLTVGHQSAASFASAHDLELVTRSIEPPDGLTTTTTIVLDRGPFDVDAEIRLLTEHRIEALVAKNSGGDATSAKLTAARVLGVPVVMVARPPQPDGPVAETVEEALSWLADRLPLSRD